MNKEKEEVEIDLLELGKKLWDNKKFIIKCSIIGAVVGLVIAFSIPKEYTTTVVLTAESNKSTGGSMGALASMAGINLGRENSDEIFSPELYPDVIKSTPFIKGLLKIHVVDDKQNINTSLYDYLKDSQKIAWWSYILRAPSSLFSLLSPKEIDNKESNNSRFISKEEMTLIEQTRNSYLINTNKKTGVISITATSQSPIISAFIADTITSYLQNYIIDQRTKKAKQNLTNSEKLYNQAKIDYYKSQQDLASFVDANMNVISARYKINQEKLQNEATLAYSIYNQMAQQVQMNKIKIQDDTPIFTVIQPAIESQEAQKPNKKMILLITLIISSLGSSFWLLRKEIWYIAIS